MFDVIRTGTHSELLPFLLADLAKPPRNIPPNPEITRLLLQNAACTLKEASENGNRPPGCDMFFLRLRIY